MPTTLTGYDAIDYAERHGLTLAKYADPTEDARTGLTIDQAEQIAAEDPSLIYCADCADQTDEIIRHGTFGPIVWRVSDGSTQAATQRDMDHFPVGDDLTADEEAGIEE